MSDSKKPDFLIQIAENDVITSSFLNDKLFINDDSVNYEILRIGKSKYQMIFNNKAYDLLVLNKSKESYELIINGKLIKVSVKDKIAQLLESLGMNTSVEELVNLVVAPMPGSILALMVDIGSEINEGEPILILEAMKMENVIKSPRSGIVKSVDAEINQSVEKGQPLISFE
ncbi:MAG: acetyl-CoA carboxylase biotin carboxyl carrier protein subunit [Cyclobacteriaceae bacterium]